MPDDEMTWSRLDDNHHERGEILDLTHEGYRLLHAMITYLGQRGRGQNCTRLDVKGLCRANGIADWKAALGDLMDPSRPHVGEDENGIFLLEDDRYHAPASTPRTQKARGKAGTFGNAGEHSGTFGNTSEHLGTPRERDARVNPYPSPYPNPDGVSKETPSLTVLPSAVQVIYEAWIEGTHRTASRTRLTDDRRKAIKRGMDMGYPLEDLIDAARGIGRDPFYMGDNDRGKPFNELFNVFKSAATVERFRDLERGLVRNEPTNESDRRVMRRLQGGTLDA